jgi:hypothetical protein
MTIIISTVWQIVNYDVWGNSKDGYEVNQIFYSGNVEMPVKLEVYNPGIEGEFYDGSPNDTQIRKALGITPRVRIYDPYCNERVIYANHVSTDYPLGELRLVSHDTLAFSAHKVITGYKWIKTDGKLYPVFKLANGDDFMEEDWCLALTEIVNDYGETTIDYKYTKAEMIQHATSKLKLQGYAIPRRYLELDPDTF